MWWASSEVVNLYLGTRAAILAGSNPPVVVSGISDWDQAMDAISQASEQLASRASIAVWLSGGLCRAFMLPVVDGLTSKAERLAVACSSAPSATGLVGPCSVWLDDGPFDQPCAGAAVNEAVLEALNELVLKRWPAKSRLKQVRPWWSECLRHAAKHSDAVDTVVVQDCDSLTILNASGSRFDRATTVWPVTDQASGEAAFSRLQMSWDVDLGAVRKYRLQPTRATAFASNPDLMLGEWSEVLE